MYIVINLPMKMNQTPQDSESHIYISIQAENSFASEAQIVHSHISQPTTKVLPKRV